MTTSFYVGLFYEDTMEDNPSHRKQGKLAWYRLHYTHAKSFEEALKKLLPRLSQHKYLAQDVPYFLIWKDRKGKITDVVNVTSSVMNRWNKLQERRRKRVIK